MYIFISYLIAYVNPKYLKHKMYAFSTKISKAHLIHCSTWNRLFTEAMMIVELLL